VIVSNAVQKESLFTPTKLVPAWLVGERTYEDALTFMLDLEKRLSCPVQLTTDGLHVYIKAVKKAFREHWVDYAMLQKIYGAPEEVAERRYSPAVCTGSRTEYIAGNPDGPCEGKSEDAATDGETPPGRCRTYDSGH
jgi:hypothetical protein